MNHDDRDVFVIGLVLLVLIAALFNPRNAEAGYRGCFPDYYEELDSITSSTIEDSDGNIHGYVCDDVAASKGLRFSGIKTGILLKRLVCDGQTFTLWVVNCNEA